MSSLSISGHGLPSATVDAPTKAKFERCEPPAKNVQLPGDIPNPPQFDDSYEERAYLKGRLALAFRIFAKHGFDEGVAGHITVKVFSTSKIDSYYSW